MALQAQQRPLESKASAPATGTATVTVACKIPHGLWLRIFVKRTEMQLVMGGGAVEMDVWKPTGRAFRIAGNTYDQRRGPTERTIGGFALTHGVPKDLWDAWVEQNRLHDAVVNGLIFAHEGDAKTQGEATEKVKLQSGLERIDPNNLPLEFQRDKLKTADEFKRMVAQ